MSGPMRRERDALGEIAVPAQALWGAQTQRALENFPISAQRSDPSLVRALAQIKQAAALANGDLQALDARIAAAIAGAAAEIARGDHRDQIVVGAFQAGAGTSLHMNLCEVIANLANRSLGREIGGYEPVDPHDQVNRSQSTNDVFPTAMRLAALERGDELDAVLGELAAALEAKASQFDGILKSGRTHLQDAVPLRLGQEVGGWARAVERCRATITQALEPLHELGLGGTAVGTGLNAPRAYRAGAIAHLRLLTGRAELREAPDAFEAMQSLAVFATLSGALRGAALELGRIANDLRLLSSGPRTGLAELVLPAVQPGSSIMPGKVNPSVPEMLNQVCFQVLGCDAVVAAAVGAGQLELNVMMPVVAFNLLWAQELLSRSVAVFTARCVRGLDANAERCRAYAHASVALATVLNPLLGYDQAAEVVKAAERTGRSIPEEVAAMRLGDPERVRAAFDPDRLTEPPDGQPRQE